MAVGKITAASVMRVPVTPGKDNYLWDTEIKGFGVKVTPAGSRRYLMRYEFAGRQRRVSIGLHGSPWTPETARRRARELAVEIARGNDPAKAPPEAAASVTVAEAFKRFLDEHVRPKRRPTTARGYEENWRNHIAPAIGEADVRQVHTGAVIEIHHRLRETPYQANRVLALLSSFFGWSEKRGYRDRNSNPCAGIEKYQEHARQRFLDESEVARVGAALRELREAGRISVHAAAAVQLLLLTGARRTEVLSLRWSDIDRQRRQIHIRQPKEGRANYLPLTDAVDDVLATLTGVGGAVTDFVLPGRLPGTHLQDIKRSWAAICEHAGLEGVRVHDLRHTFASVGAGMGLSLQAVGHLLGHSQVSTTQRYAHLAPDPVAQAASGIAGELARHLRKIATSN
ncbi:MAG: site-specific integrase [Pseudomonadota bacterium]|nr:site-specific integrase [Pseudomonadota bacterium]